MKKSSFLDKFLHRIDRVGPGDLQHYLMQLARDKGFLEAIFNSLQEAILVVDPDGRIIYMNDGVERLLGIPLEDALHQPVTRYLRDVDWTSILGERRSLSRDFEVSYPERRYLNLTLVPLEDDGQERGGFALIFRDLTSARAETQEAIESEKLGALTLLAAGVAHELGNPLNSLDIHLQLLERDLKRLGVFKKDQNIAESWQVLRTEMSRLDTILVNFLRAIRPTTPQLQLENVNALLEESIEFLRPEIRDRELHVETRLDAAAPPLWVDRDQLKQAFYNLIKNALQAMPAGGKLLLSTERTDTHLVITFADNGAGIPPEKIGRIFEPYFTTKPSGSGLGLLIVRRIVREHGGDLELESHPGAGTTVRLLLPLPEKRVRLLPAGESAA
ncbi:MAG: ATP-binding protein [Verrucomicrobium sp.]|nr:ATP-binding protein [Verrucomicrobium sp.]